MSDARLSLDIWVIYDNPLDAPGKFVARRHTLDGPTDEAYEADSLEDARGLIPDGLVRMPRDGRDEPQIVETWI
jgi:hypothetical protein